MRRRTKLLRSSSLSNRKFLLASSIDSCRSFPCSVYDYNIRWWRRGQPPSFLHRFQQAGSISRLLLPDLHYNIYSTPSQLIFDLSHSLERLYAVPQQHVLMGFAEVFHYQLPRFSATFLRKNINLVLQELNPLIPCIFHMGAHRMCGNLNNIQVQLVF